MKDSHTVRQAERQGAERGRVAMEKLAKHMLRWHYSNRASREAATCFPRQGLLTGKLTGCILVATPPATWEQVLGIAILGVPRNVDLEPSYPGASLAKIITEITEKTPEFGQKIAEIFHSSKQSRCSLCQWVSFDRPSAVKLASGALSRVPENPPRHGPPRC
jgi:hypothetical protein